MASKKLEDKIVKYFYTLQEVAKLLGCKYDTLRKYYYLGRNLPKITVFPTGRKMVSKKDYQEYMENK